MHATIANFISPGATFFQLGPITLRWYGLLIAISVLAGLNLSNHLARKKDLGTGLINDLFPLLILSAVIGARIYYVAFQWREYKQNFFEIFKIWNGGIAIHGALIFGTITVLIFCRLRRQNFWDVLDVLLPSVSLGQAIGRWGNFFNNEAFGVPTELPWKLSIPYLYRPIEFSDYQYFHPTFMYESVWNIGVFILLMALFNRSIKGIINLPTGALSCIYLLSYSVGRFWIEGLRIDPLCINSLPPFCEGGVRAAQLISFILISLSSIGLWWIFSKREKLPSFDRGEHN